MSDIVPSCNAGQYQGKLMMQIWENGENQNFGPTFGKLMNQACENGEKPDFGPNFGSFGSNLGLKTFFCGF